MFVEILKLELYKLIIIVIIKLLFIKEIIIIVLFNY
jgi:hypothetical protein